MYSILQAKWLQSKAFVLSLLDTNGEIFHTLPHGHKDYFWAYPGANKPDFLLKQLCNSKLRCGKSHHSDSLIKKSATSNKKVSLINRYEKQCGGNNDQAQVYTIRTHGKVKYSNVEIVNILQFLNKDKLSYVPPIKPKGDDVFVVDWQNDENKVKDYTADQYMWVADATKQLFIHVYSL